MCMEPAVFYSEVLIAARLNFDDSRGHGIFLFLLPRHERQSHIASFYVFRAL